MTLRPLSIALALAASAAFGNVSAANAEVMDAWKAYAQSAMTPAFAWAQTPQAPAPTLRSGLFGAAPADVLSIALSRDLSLRFSEKSLPLELKAASYSSLQGRLSGFSQTNFSSTLSTQLPGNVGLDFSAVIAQQQFLTPGMGGNAWRTSGQLSGASFGPNGEVASGFGLRADLQLPVSSASRWVVSMQSRVDMETFKSYRGVYSEAGDFDAPAYAGLRFAHDIGRATFSAGFDRIFYSDITAVTSYGLPNRLLSLLGDGNSPEFAWRDHTVYRLGMEYALGQNGELSLRYSTRLQPSPNSALLRRAMQEDFSDRNFALGYRHALGQLGSLLFSASHSGASYFVGAAPLRQSGFDKGSINEFEVLWALPF